MLTVVIIMTAGIILGYFVRGIPRIVQITDKLTIWAIFMLLFLLGIAIGANEVIVKNLPILGLKAFIVAIGGVAGSVFVAWIGYNLWFKAKSKGNEE